MKSLDLLLTPNTNSDLTDFFHVLIPPSSFASLPGFPLWHIPVPRSQEQEAVGTFLLQPQARCTALLREICKASRERRPLSQSGKGPGGGSRPALTWERSILSWDCALPGLWEKRPFSGPPASGLPKMQAVV